jgi:3-phytase
MRHLVICGLVCVAACGADQAGPVAEPIPVIEPDLVTASVSDDADDPAFWLHPSDPAQSLIVGTNKVAAPAGALVVFGLDGRIRQTISGIDRPNNVDIETGVLIDGALVDVAVTTERLQHRLRVFRIAPDGSGLSDWGSVPVLAGQTGDQAEPMGIGLYTRPSDGALFAIVAPKLGPASGYLWQYRLVGDGAGGLVGTFVRRFGNFSERGAEPGEPGEIEAIVVDDELGYVYYADERFAIHKWHADPDHANADTELAVFGEQGYQMDREGLALYRTSATTGYLVSTDQIPGGSVYKRYRREGEPGAPHLHVLVDEVTTNVDETDGLEVTAAQLPGFSGGLLIAMNSGPRNFALFSWDRLFAKDPE